MNNNFFAITRLGQLRNVQGYIEQSNYKNNILMIMFTPDAVDLIENINKSINHKLFKEVIHFELPKRPLGVNREKCKNLYENLTETLFKLHNKYNIKNIFLCNTDNFYVYFEDVANSINADLILLEEGLTTYRMFANGMGKSFTFRDVKSSFHRILRDFKKLFVSIVVFILQFLSWIFGINIFEFIKHRRIPKKYRYGDIKHFKEAYVCFPEKMRELTTKEEIGEVKKLDFFVNKDLDKEIVDKLENNMTLFVNQRYIPYDMHFSIIFEIMERAGINKFFIKFHPKESRSMYLPYLIKAMEEHPNLDVKILEGLDHIPAEDLMTTGKINRLIGITTSTLIYSQLIDPKIEVLSIADSYKELCLSKEYNVDARKMDLFLRDYKAFKEVFDIKQV
jgi:hypothetical protein